MDLKLPIETIENIVDHIDPENHRPSLHAAALTCKDLLYRSRLHLFRRVYIKSRTQFEDLSIFLDQRPVLKARVHEMWIFFPGPRPGERLTALHDVATTRIIHKLPNVRLLAYTSHEPTNPLPVQFRQLTLTCLKHYPGTIRILSLSNCTLKDVAEYARLLLALPMLYTHTLGPLVMVYEEISPSRVILLQSRLSRTSRISDVRVSPPELVFVIMMQRSMSDHLNFRGRIYRLALKYIGI